MPDLPTGTVTLLFTDIERSTNLLQRLGGEQSPSSKMILSSLATAYTLPAICSLVQ